MSSLDKEPIKFAETSAFLARVHLIISIYTRSQKGGKQSYQGCRRYWRQPFLHSFNPLKNQQQNTFFIEKTKKSLCIWEIVRTFVPDASSGTGQTSGHCGLSIERRYVDSCVLKPEKFQKYIQDDMVILRVIAWAGITISLCMGFLRTSRQRYRKYSSTFFFSRRS